jgi:DNA-binding response OmpR family regulator
MAVKKILIAEDEKPLANALQMKLNNTGFDASTVFNGKEALDAIKKGTYDLLLLDLVMPIMDGFSVLEEVKKLKSKLKIIVSTNLSQDQDKAKAMDLGAVDYFVKSDTPLTEVIKKVTKALS